ncbi:hypothetical protein F4819DRAFT_476889 [Hypoxylon fuscum]|nr:hypothetical protein F4819DRAFT_476889 [Hypoxylon fuscum]
MADEDLLHQIHGLGDLDLAALLCLVSREHCIIRTASSSLATLTQELRLVASQTFRLPSAVVHCSPRTTLDDLAAAIQLPPPTPTPTPKTPQQDLTTPRSASASPLRRRDTASSYFGGRHGHGHGHGRHGSNATTNQGYHTSATPPPPQIANVILATNLDRAPKDVQIQCLELLRTRRILTRTSVQTAPKQFLFVAVLASEPEPESESEHGAESGHGAKGGLVSHLNDFFYVSHWHDPEDGFAHLEEQQEQEQDEEDANRDRDRDREKDGADAETASLDSASSVVVRRSVSEMPMSTPRTDRSRNNIAITNITTTTTTTQTQTQPQTQTQAPENDTASSLSPTHQSTTIPEPALASLAQLTHRVHLDVDVQRYALNIVSFLRLHRAVSPAPGASAVSPQATRHLLHLSRCLAAVHGLAYVTPALVGLAARKVYAHRVRVARPEDERSVQWGSEVAAVRELLDGWSAEDVLQDVLDRVAPPL